MYTDCMMYMINVQYTVQYSMYKVLAEGADGADWF